MRVNYNYIKVVLLLVVVVFLCAFSTVRNSSRKVATPAIKFVGDDNLFVTHETVSKLLIQNQETVTNKPKDIIDLNELESALNSNPMIKRAQVFMSVDGLITAEIEQKKPIARVSTNASYYIDDTGSFMPLSTNYTARVPLVTGYIEKNDLAIVHAVAKKVQSDEFLTKHVVEIHQNQDKTIDLKFRSHDFNIHLGTLKLLDKKINNLKAFYKKAMKDDALDNYKLVNLKFDKQVICTKK
ncbi:cell division protein FtsQ/DivIB [Psychroserpens sp. SPM9]|uniref:cell division protein FtsQ/DivIB n=1 Tax=Psychroserpens sp. SPM9 TaxID=2975598 RepID=UPI0021A467E8|nr:cell division protein FtsQ/DivIB [Psychroserpens sp. SPM9]MDG5490162.1 cell division protein FtsQ/DivIB [Psychroserpens sp. SPM9]